MRDEERKPDQADVGERQHRQAATDDEQPLYGEPSSDTDADGGLEENPLTRP